jgi:hypothetical protein
VTLRSRVAILAFAVFLVAMGCDDAKSGAPTRGTAAQAPIPTTRRVPPRAEGEPAVWFVGAHDRPSAASTSFTAYVTRVGCNDGVTGTVLPPTIDERETQLVVTFAVEPSPPGNHTCPSNNRVPIVVKFGEAIANRQIIDGACDSSRNTPTSAFCRNGRARWPT